MSDEQENVGAGSETSGETTETTPVEAAETTTTETPTETPSETPAEANAGGAADASTDATPNAEESRTGFVDEKGVQPGDECACPDGRKGTVHRFDNGLVCIPNADQG